LGSAVILSEQRRDRVCHCSMSGVNRSGHSTGAKQCAAVCRRAKSVVARL
jgi:hypothetical protein